LPPIGDGRESNCAAVFDARYFRQFFAIVGLSFTRVVRALREMKNAGDLILAIISPGDYQLEKWQQEGYADYVGKGGIFDFAAVQRDFRAGVPALDPRRSGLYLRYHLLVAELIDHKGMTPEALLSHAIEAAPLEQELARR
jgi:hypothetical protein